MIAKAVAAHAKRYHHALPIFLNRASESTLHFKVNKEIQVSKNKYLQNMRELIAAMNMAVDGFCDHTVMLQMTKYISIIMSFYVVQAPSYTEG
jgi:hypothetical protein